MAVNVSAVLSGLFFRGREGRLLMVSLRRRVTLIFAEDVVDDVYSSRGELSAGVTNSRRPCPS